MNFKDLIVESTCTIRDALLLIDKAGTGICFVVENNVLIGIATDGDIRRALINNVSIDDAVRNAMNHDFQSLPFDSPAARIKDALTNRIKYLPLCDKSGKIVDVADVRKYHSIPVLEPKIAQTEFDLVMDCLQTGWISSQGGYVREFEKLFSDMHNQMYALAVSNGTTALHLALAALGIGEGDEVIVPDITFAATINAVLYCNATPVICEVSSETWCIDVREFRKLITRKTKAIIPVHLYGVPCEMDEIVSICKDKGIYIVEDCAEAIGSEFNGKIVGTFGDAATFSFFGNKTISTGEGGMVIFKEKDIADRATVLRDHGMSKGRRYWHETVGFNYRLTNIQAALGCGQMKRFSEILNKKLFILKWYNAHLSGITAIKQLPFSRRGSINSNWLYTLQLADDINRDAIAVKLLENGIETRPTFYPLHTMPPYKNFMRSENLYNSIAIFKNGLSLPTSLSLTTKELQYITDTLIECINI